MENHSLSGIISAPKTFCVVSAMYAPSTGGVERYAHNLAYELVAQGHRVVVLACNTHGAPAYEEDDGLHIYRMPCRMALSERLPLLKRGKERRMLERRLRMEPIDGFILNTRLYPLVAYAARLAKSMGRPSILIDHSSAHMAFSSPVLGLLGRGYEHLLTAFLKHYCHQFYGVSQKSADWLAHYHIHARGVLYNAVDIAEIEALCSRPNMDIHIQYHIPADATIVLFAARLIPEKGVMNLVDAVEAANRDGGHFHLLVAGEGPLQKTLLGLNSTHIHVLGRLNHDAVIAHMHEADIFCLPTAYPEGFPTTLLEATTAGCFCVATAAGGAGELIPTEDYGLLLEDNNIDTLQHALEDAAARPDYREKAATIARRRVAERYTWEKTVRQVLSAFSQEKEAAAPEPSEEQRARLLLIVPAYNEQDNIERVVDSLTTQYPQFDYVIVNDGSRDATADICRQRCYNCIHLPINLGLTAAVQTGMRYAYQHGYDAAVQFDSDGQHRAEYLDSMLEKIREGYDIVIGSRYMLEKKAINLRMFGSHLISRMIRITTRVPITDPTSGMRMYNRRMIREFSNEMNYGPEPDTISYLIRRGASLIEVPVEMDERIAGQSYFTFLRSAGYMLHMGISILIIQWARKKQ